VWLRERSKTAEILQQQPSYVHGICFVAGSPVQWRGQELRITNACAPCFCIFREAAIFGQP
jgi:hypothetical protein